MYVYLLKHLKLFSGDFSYNNYKLVGYYIIYNTQSYNGLFYTLCWIYDGSTMYIVPELLKVFELGGSFEIVTNKDWMLD